MEMPRWFLFVLIEIMIRPLLSGVESMGGWVSMALVLADRVQSGGSCTLIIENRVMSFW